MLFVMAVAFMMLLFRRTVALPLKQMKGVVSALSRKDYSVEAAAADRNDEIGAIGKALEDLRELLKQGLAAEIESTFKSAAFTGSSSCIMITDDKMVVNYLNPKMTELFRHHAEGIRLVRPDFDPDDIVGRSVDHFHKNNSEHIRAKMRSIGSSTFNTVVAFGDARISLSVTGIRDVKGDQVGYVLEWIDVTESRLNGAIIEAIDSTQIKAEFALDGRCIGSNGQFLKSLGFSENEILKKTLQQILTSSADKSKDCGAIMEKAIQSSAHIGMLLFSTSGGASSTVDGSLTCVKDYNGKAIRLLLLGKDVTKEQAELHSARARQAADEREQSAVVEALRQGLKNLNAGDLTVRIEQPFAGTYEDLRRDYNDMVENLSRALLEIAMNAENISNEARDISATADSLSRRTESTAATLEQTAAALDNLTSSVKSTADGATKADMAVRDAKASAESSGQVVIETVSAMDQIASSSDRITSIIKVIDDIAFQTNLLALNAGVEAARAGDAGRGFAVVASEVRALAQRSSDAAREINDLIANSGTQVKRGVDLVGKTGDALRQIVGSVTEIAGLVSDIAVTSRQQSANLVEINSAVNQLDQSTQQNAARLEETTAASEGLTKDAVSLVEIVSHFKVDRASSAERAKATDRPQKAKSAKMSRPMARARSAGGSAAAAQPAEVEGWEDF
ncbi:methyl-accepting chemotaxis sensory transducer with Pas/Pac sensor [Roseicitreum antarcticum]|uniref:Methyl-accepting chemotaxis sensory transducer with Pas/Pac sensor n=1 Tax=Roseicitreum antarcticum TaxID=564137 RepID=A0A1H3ASK8_9RHOB|nr:methyl-accepting chemotaxis sensory transducer with Pas/Pac sensor [Roseicitreum antarcticum]